MPTAGWLRRRVGRTASAANAPPGRDCDLHARGVRPGDGVQSTPFDGDRDGRRGGRRAARSVLTVQVPAVMSAVSMLTAAPSSRSQAAAPAPLVTTETRRSEIVPAPSGSPTGAGVLHASPLNVDDSIVLPSIKYTVGTPLMIAACGERRRSAGRHRQGGTRRSRAPARGLDVPTRADPGGELACRHRDLGKVWCGGAGIRADAVSRIPTTRPPRSARSTRSPRRRPRRPSGSTRRRGR